MSGVGDALLSGAFFAEEGEELELLAKTVCQRLAAHGFAVSGEDVRRTARNLGVETVKVDGRLMARSDDVDALVEFMRAKRSVAERGSLVAGRV